MCAAALVLARGACAQPSPDALAPIDAVEAYMQDRGLTQPLAALLRQRLAESTGEQRRTIADRLGKIYVTLLDSAPTPDERRAVEALCRDLLAAVPDADSFALRVNVARATYLSAAEVAEKVQLRLASTEERLEAERILRAVAPTLREVAGAVGQRVDTIERKIKASPEDDALRDSLTEARRIRSLAHYYAGWSEYYLAMLTSDATMATRASEDMGALLGAPARRSAAVDKAPKSLFKYEHVARAAIGSALCASLKGNDVEAMRWMDALDLADGVPKAVTEHLFSAKLTILAAAKRWADVDLLVRRKKLDSPEIGGGPMTVRDARLLAVLTLEASKDEKLPPRSAAVIADMAKLAVSELVSAGELGQVVDLVTRYGSAPIGGNGFAVRYVQGVQSFEEARQQHRAGSEDPELPSSQPALCNQYRQAGESLGQATQAADAGSFPREIEKAQLNQGLALYYAGDLEQASEVFRRISVTSSDLIRKQDAAWYSVVALDKAIERGRPSLMADRDRLAMNFIREYPRTDRSIRLLLRRGAKSAIGDEEAAGVLLAVTADSPVYENARLEASGILYKLWLAAGPADRQAAGLRLLTVAEESLSAQVRRLSAPGASTQEIAAAASISRLARQIAHVALSMPTPEPIRAMAAMDQLEQLAPTYKIDLKAVREELMYRRLQAAILLADRTRTTELIEELRKAGGTYAAAGERLVYRELVNAWRADRQNLAAAASLVQSGKVLADALFKDAATAQLSHGVAGEAAEAAFTIWQSTGEVPMRETAMQLDRRSWDANVRSAALCRRLGIMAESTGDMLLAGQCWSQLSAALAEGSPEWFEARHEAIRLLAMSDRAAAIDAMKQLVTLHPELGRPAWDQKLRTQARDLGITIEDTPGNAAGSAATPGAAPGGKGPS